MEVYKLYKSDNSNTPIYVVVANDKHDEDRIETEYGIYHSMYKQKQDNMPKDKDGKNLPRGIYYYKSDIPISKESMVLIKLESINKNTKICKIAAWFFIIVTILSIIIGIFIAMAGSNTASGGY